MALESRWRVNVLCLIGAVIGIASIFLVWVEVRVLFWGVDLNLIDFLNAASEHSAENTGQAAYASIFVIGGVLIALLSPVGAIPQLAGTSLFIAWFVAESDGHIPSGPGVYVAIASAIIVLVSMAKPVGIGYSSSAIKPRDRLLTFNIESTSQDQRGAKPAWAGMYCKYCGRPLAEEATVCPGCGRPVSRPPEVS